MFKLQTELVKLQEWVKATGARVVIIFEGRDAAGKGGIIKRIAERTSPRVFRVVALPAPTERQKSQIYMQRYVEQLPAGGEIVIFDRSWYNRAGVEHVMGFCTKEQYTKFLKNCPSVRNVAGQRRHHPAEVLAGSQREGAAPAVPGAHQRPVEALEAEPDGPGVASPLVRLFAGARRHAGGDRHSASAVVHRSFRRQEAGAAELHCRHSRAAFRTRRFRTSRRSCRRARSRRATKSRSCSTSKWRSGTDEAVMHGYRKYSQQR